MLCQEGFGVTRAEAPPYRLPGGHLVHARELFRSANRIQSDLDGIAPASSLALLSADSRDGIAPTAVPTGGQSLGIKVAVAV